MTGTKPKNSWECLLLWWFVVVSASMSWAIPTVAAEAGVVPPAWLFHKSPKGIPEPGGLYAEYFDSNGNFVKEIQAEGPIDHGYGAKGDVLK